MSKFICQSCGEQASSQNIFLVKEQEKSTFGIYWKNLKSIFAMNVASSKVLQVHSHVNHQDLNLCGGKIIK
jgi:hypothetical protein